MILYRIGKCIYADNLSGEWSRLYGGRWNSEGKPALYLASSRSLAMLEVLVHLQPLMIPNDFCLVEVEVPGSSISQVLVDDLPGNWKDVSPPRILKQIGNNFLENKRHLMLKVPSSIVPMEHNYLVNVLHPDMKKVKVLSKEPFDFDSRLV
ncbi:RES family NAD+ phosphorylase [Mucilaginibacter sp. BJC16-A38]|uniref:RES family NAD+ phosphorylase n=1 Tax=Mucilaginibacter phenanthrenivorans TaxID=1234842 RepID=UPI00215778F0|nr:RES family NAD+ phosphorylase [Mucilaginibacter phenanthrenivorans]MCR8561308.1 RES family NAD+ phosphorylase [Mucilaginibacter phenanthrenivorans]